MYFTQLAAALNDAGLDYKAVIDTSPVEIPWTPALVKEFWKAIQEIQLGKGHTAELTTKEIDEVYDTLNRHLAQFGIAVSFPSEDSMRLDSLDD